MDKMLSVHSKKANKQPKTTKKKTVKVVYISNPVMVKTSAAEFRALVQQLTGQDAKIPLVTETVGTGGTGLQKNGKLFRKGFYNFVESPSPTADQQFVHGDPQVPNYVNTTEATMTDNSDLSFEDYAGEDYVPELLENLPGLMGTTSNLWYD